MFAFPPAAMSSLSPSKPLRPRIDLRNYILLHLNAYVNYQYLPLTALSISRFALRLASVSRLS